MAARSLDPGNPGVPTQGLEVEPDPPPALAERLDSDQPVDARGVAQISALLAEVRGPVYDRSAADDLEPALQAVIQALEVKT